MARMYGSVLLLPVLLLLLPLLLLLSLLLLLLPLLLLLVPLFTIIEGFRITVCLEGQGLSN